MGTYLTQTPILPITTTAPAYDISLNQLPGLCNSIASQVQKNPGSSTIIGIIIVILILICLCCSLSMLFGWFGYNSDMTIFGTRANQ